MPVVDRLAFIWGASSTKRHRWMSTTCSRAFPNHRSRSGSNAGWSRGRLVLLCHPPSRNWGSVSSAWGNLSVMVYADAILL